MLSDKQGRILDEVEVKGLEADSSYARDGSGSWSVQTKPTPGFANNDDCLLYTSHGKRSYKRPLGRP